MKLVLDTNVVIDWLVFDDEYLASFREQVRSGSIQIITHGPAVEELRRVLAYPTLKLGTERQAAVLEQYAVLASLVESDQAAALPVGFPRCRDPDDDPFVRFAWQMGADALVSRDKAVLKLARKARKFGLQICDVPRMVSLLGTAPSVMTSSTQLSSSS